MRTPKALRIRLRKHRPHRIPITNRAKIRPMLLEELSKINQFSLDLPYKGNSFISVTPPPDQKSLTHPDHYVQFWAIFATKIQPKNIRHLYVINHLFLTFRARISKMS